MKKILLSIALLTTTAAPSMAQIYHPIALDTVAGGSKKPQVAISLQGTYFKWQFPSPPGTTTSVSQKSPSGLLAVDVTSSKFVYGVWTAADTQSFTAKTSGQPDFKANFHEKWYEGHAAYMFTQSPKLSLGGLVGYLDNPYDGAPDWKWTELAVVGSVPLGKAATGKPSPLLGFTVGRALHATSQNPDATSYGISLTFPLSDKWSIDASTWELAFPSFHGMPSSTVTRAGGGVGYHF